MTTLIENAAALADIAKVMGATATQVEADCDELSLHVGADWAGRPALTVTDAAALVSGAARRDHDHTTAHLRWRAASDGWEADREQARRDAYNAIFNAERARGLGDSTASYKAAQAGSAAVGAFELNTPQPVFGDAAPSRLSQVKTRVKEVVR